MNERELLLDCLRRLNQTGVTYYLTGSMASHCWGIPRTTHDLDFVVQLPTSAVPRIVQEFAGDFYIEESAVRAAFKPPHQFNAIDTRSALKVDFLCERSGLVIELDGAQHLGDPEAYRRDRRKDALLQQRGYFVLRFLAEDAGKRLDSVLDAILAALVHRDNQRRF
jgi:very-short-patch-repair endonuclease